jgi:membrane-associated phospholipid phosphatase
MNNPESWAIQRRLLLGALVCATLLAAGYFALVSTAWGHQLDDDGYFGRHALNRKLIRLDAHLLDFVSVTALLAAGAVLLAIAAARRCLLIGLIAVLTFGGAVLGAEILKHSLPWHALVPDDGLLESRFQADTYPSGHATIGTSFALGLLLVCSSRWRPWLAVVGGSFSATFATSVLFAGWHRPSDALGALAWSGFCMTLAAALAVRLQGRPRSEMVNPRRAIFGSAGLGIVIMAATWGIAAEAAPDYPYADLPFLVFTGLTIAGAFSLITWFAWQLRAVDWPTDSSLRFEQ